MDDYDRYITKARKRNRRNDNLATMLKLIFVAIIVIILIWLQVGLWTACLDGNIGACLLAR